MPTTERPFSRLWKKTSIVVEFPKLLFFSEKRSRERETIPAPGKVLLEITLPYPKGSIIQREVLDLSSTGLSFKTPASRELFSARHSLASASDCV